MERLRFLSFRGLSRSTYCLLGVLLLGIFFRLYAITHGVTFHPDERHIVDVTTKLSRADMNPHSFAYGSFPFYFSWAVAQLLGLLWPSLMRYDGMFIVGRCVAAFFGVASILLTYLLAQRVYASRSVSILAAALVALNVFHIQLSRFFAVDIFLTAWCIAALVACVRLSQQNRARDYLLAGVSLGFAFATKISAMTLLAPLFVAIALHGIASNQLFSWRRIAWTVATLLLAGLVFLAVEPYAVLDSVTFLKNTKEQTDMVQGLWRPPYTIQYADTTPYLYVLSQMTFYTMGIPLALAVFLGFGYSFFRQFSKIRPAELVLLAWVIPLFLSFGGLQVKFPRYFLPIYPVLFVFAAHFLIEIGSALARTRVRFLRNVPTAIVVTWCFVYAVAFSRIYSVDHGYEIASRWIFQNVPAGSTILGVDWDDKLPLFLPGLDPRRFRAEGRAWELPLYGNETPEKLAEVSEKLARGDYIIFPTARTYGSIPRIPEEYVFTTNMLRLLFAEKLGYKLEQTIKIRPHFGPIEFNDDLADESLSVYDHPKISIFKKTEALSALDIRQRILDAYQYRPLPTLQDMLLADSGSGELATTTVRPTLLPTFLWLLILELLGLIALPFAMSLFPTAPDKGYGIAKTGGLLLVGASVWILGSLHWIPTNARCTWIILGMLAATAMFLFSRQHPSLRQILKQNHKPFLVGELLFLVGFFGFVILRAFQPEIFWGEKPMDFTFLNYFIRLESLPPQDPWAAGQVMRYYYFGSFLMALLHKLSGIDSAIGYNLSIATIAGLSLSGAYTFILICCRKIWPAVIGALAVLLMSNLEVLRLVFFSEKKGFDLFWASSRLYREPGITEYPLWALLFADLHAHLIVYPLIFLLLALATRFLHHERDSLTLSLVAHRFACGVVLSSLVATNSWDAISYGFLFGVLMLYRSLLVVVGRRGRFKRFCSALLDLLRDIPLVSLGILPIFVLFMLSSGSQVALGFGFNQKIEFDTLDQVLRHLGQWLLPIFLAFLLLSFKNLRRTPIREIVGRLLLGLFFGAFPLGICFLTLLPAFEGRVPALQDLPWSIPALCSGISFLAVFVGMGKRYSHAVRMASVFCYCAMLLISGAELCFLMDHMNTIFKFYNAVWMLCGLSVACLLPTLVLELWNLRPRLLAYTVGRPLCLAVTSVFAIACAGSLMNMHTMVTFQRVAGPRPTLDGMAYQHWMYPQEGEAIRWIRKNIRGTPTLLEAHGDSYQNFTRISMNTGLPTVLGWSYHVQQRGTADISIAERRRLINEIYSAPDPESAVANLQMLGVDLIYVGPLERELYERGTYNRAGLRKWDEHPDVFQPLFRSGTSVVYKTTWARLP
ncbi:MAG: glycosyltransferase family 39 protein [Deltaproteobacteria bacterium]|nr:glycosyltransferase family 39 protein [Deltaproteobacteria bacterium]